LTQTKDSHRFTRVSHLVSLTGFRHFEQIFPNTYLPIKSRSPRLSDSIGSGPENSIFILLANLTPSLIMGLLALGTALDWPDAKKRAPQVREWGIKQLLEIWNKAKGKERDALLWGDEVEYLVVVYSEDNQRVLLSLRQAQILEALAADKDLEKQGGCVPELQEPITTEKKTERTIPVFHPEFGRFMLEATPGKPWGIGFKELLDVEPDMKLRRKIAKEHMLSTEYPITLTTYPQIGVPGQFTDPYFPPSGPRLRSQFVPDEIANPHIRFPTLAANIRSRRGRKVQVNVPIFHDKNTPKPWKDPTVNFDKHDWPEDDDVRNGAAPDDFIHMDAMAFGMGSCCLQITFQAKNITEGRMLYDQLSPLGPIMLALTAATPVYKGFLANTDVRWNQISRAVDCRTPEELGEKSLTEGVRRIPKSRYASNSTYIAIDPRLRNEYLDPDLVYDSDIKRQLLEGGMDDRLATHFAHLFIRDPIVVFEEDLQELDLNKTDHFENIQSTNWQHMRFKPPPADNSIGWRVEFRSMEIQITDFENAAFSVFMVLVTRAILSFDLNFYIPIKKVDENMERAHEVDAVLKEKFYFRRNPFPSRPSRANTTFGDDSRPGSAHPSRPPSPGGPVEHEFEEMTVNNIINGSESGEFPGLIPIVESYLDSVNVDVSTRCHLSTYLDLISKRASGELDTTARWIRNFIDVHPKYNHDSVVNDEINHDLIGAVIAIGERETAGRNFAGLGIHGLERLLNGFRGGCGGESSNGSNGNSHAAETDTINGSLKRKSEWIDGHEVVAS
jgi:glutamate--cysteine ligase catalytic subunit